MRLFGLGKRKVQHDAGQQAALLAQVRQGLGAHVQGRFPDQAAAVGPYLQGDDGLMVAATILREFADTANDALAAQCADIYRRTGHRMLVDRRNYRPLWREAGHALQWPLFALPCSFHPYVHVQAAATAIGRNAGRFVDVTDSYATLTHLFETLDLLICGWEFGRVRVDADSAMLADRLIQCATDVRAAMPQEPPLPQPVRELMRRNNTVDVYLPTGQQVVGQFNPGRTMREKLLA
ncbi:hypothetical protein [Catenuloplanes atrovinosus]|uniref:Uncharacterized protein n=1 Tax=Catenuloplanes atrovinosus TaxID=137266 RepID=A0AAE3YMV6_9ACTN|nr:hypothetical protein [Catenuloplanes atrovinosus]MDR7275410.1 hypothetical protein [Catenuloplanes atrovinosus]